MYLVLQGQVGAQTFGHDRWLNQRFYTSPEWRRTRRDIIVRDSGCDLAVEGFDIHSDILIHHMNPIKAADIVHRDEDILNPEYLITTTLKTHNAIHYGDLNLLVTRTIERTPGDTKLW